MAVIAHRAGRRLHGLRAARICGKYSKLKAMNTDAKTTELVDLEKKYWQAMKERDTQTCVDLSFDGCLVTGAQGVGRYTKAQMKQMMEEGAQYILNDYELKEMKADMLGNDIGIVAYTVRQDLTVEGKPITVEAADTSTWVRNGGKWECAMHSESILGDAFGRDKDPGALKL